MIRRLLYLMLVVLLAPALYAFTYEGALFLVSIFSWDTAKWFLLGASLSLFAYVLFLHNNINFIEHALHETEHAVLAFLFTFKLPTRMEIDPEKGSKVVAQKAGGCLPILAPYYLPLLTVPFLLLKGLADLVLPLLGMSLPPALAVVLDLLIGATWIFHLICTLREFRLFQTDITKTGLITSLIAVVFLNLMFLVFSIVVVTESYTEVWDYVKASVARSRVNYQAAWAFFQAKVLPFLPRLKEAVRGLLG